MDASDVRRWFETPPGRVVAWGIVASLVALVGLALAGFDLAIVLLLALIGVPIGLAAAYLVSGPLRRRSTGRGRAPRLLVVWIAYVVLTTFIISGELFFGSAGSRGEPSGTLFVGFVQSFGLCFWFLLIPLSRGARLTDGFDRRWTLAALGLHISGLLVALLIGVAAAVYVLWSSTG